MSPAKMFGVLLIVLGGVMLAYKGFSYTKREKIIDLGPIQATAETRERVDVPVIVGGLILAGGVALLLAGGRSRGT
jgi:uncharacterized membrane protein